MYVADGGTNTVKVFVTGGNGFIGSQLVRRLVSSGHQVRCLLRATSRTERIDDLSVERACGDARDLASVRTAIEGCDGTIHLATPSSWEDDASSGLTEIVEQGTRHVLEAAAVLRDHRVVFVSSTAAINGSATPRIFDERSEFTLDDPALVYAHAKHRAEICAREMFECRAVQVITVNPAEVYGPGDTALVTAGNLIDFVKSTPVLVCRGGTSVVHVEDVAAGIIAALEKGQPGERYILGGENLTIRRLAELCLELVGRRAAIFTIPNSVVRVVSRAAIRFRIPVPYNPHVVPYATRYWFVDNTKARRDLGVTFRDARETIGSTLDWLRATGRV
jgi:dihydroflavonol-4-reductase